jgi:DNA-binding transcriptional LysR family regulator
MMTFSQQVRPRLMRQRLPSLSNLRLRRGGAASESARAAADLYITESAVSRQIASLESLLGVQLFHRANQRITLTAAGVLYSRQVREMLRKLQRDTLDIMAHEGVGGTVELACVPTLAVEWLIPRLPGFYARHLQVIVNIRAQSDVFLFEGTPYDAAIHFGEAVYPGARVDRMFGEESVAVCHPDFFGGKKRVSVNDIARSPLLHLVTRSFGWKQWMEAAGIDDVNALRGALRPPQHGHQRGPRGAWHRAGAAFPGGGVPDARAAGDTRGAITARDECVLPRGARQPANERCDGAPARMVAGGSG